MVSHQYPRANAHGIKNQDASKRNSYIIYLGSNNLYGWGMSQALPTSNFKWLTDKEMAELDVMMVCLGKCYFYYLYIYVYFIKCTISSLCISKYPHGFHDLQKDYALAPERLQIEEIIFSDYQRHLLQDEGFSKPQPNPSRVDATKRVTSSNTAI